MTLSNLQVYLFVAGLLKLDCADFNCRSMSHSLPAIVELLLSFAIRYTRPRHIAVASCNSFSSQSQITINLLQVLRKLISLRLVLNPRDFKYCRLY